MAQHLISYPRSTRLPDAIMTSTSNKAKIARVASPLHKYRWELTLFIGIPLVVDVISLAVWELRVLVSEVLPNRHIMAHYAVAGIVKMAALGILWWRVRHLGRPYFSLLVLYAFFVAFPGVELVHFWRYWCSLQHPVHALQEALAGKNAIDAEEYATLVAQVRHITPDWYCVSDYIVFTILTYTLVSIKVALLIWFVWLASRFSMFHATVFIGLSTALGGVHGFMPQFIPTLLGDVVITSIKVSNYGHLMPQSLVALWPISLLVAIVLRVALSCMAIKVLGDFSPGMDVLRKYITVSVLLISLATSVQLFYNWNIWIDRQKYLSGSSATAVDLYLRSPEGFILSYALVVVFAFGVWRLFPPSNAGDSDSTPMDPSPAQTSHDSVGAAGEETTSRRV